MLQPSPPSQTFGCLFGLLGMLSGMLLGSWHWGRHVEAMRTADPDVFICGNPAIGALFGGAILGGFAGTVLGAVIGTARENPEAEAHDRRDRDDLRS